MKWFIRLQLAELLLATTEQNHKYPWLENKIPEKDTYIYVRQ